MVVADVRMVDKAGEVQFLERNLADSTGLADRALELPSRTHEARDPGSPLHPHKGMLGC
jgi:hypothetical protein